MPLVVPSGPEGQRETVTVASPLQHLCPFKDEVDRGTVTVEFAVDGLTFELHELSAYFGSFAGETISHEALTGRIFTDLSSNGLAVLGVTTEWVTAGMHVVVRRS
jgi:NADPH-dependent 7-cyano-7-deazaguanine reductase QueF